jgi:hypothetical protein
VIAATTAAVALARGSVVESVTQHSAIISFVLTVGDDAYALGASELEAFHSLGNGHGYRFAWASAAVVVLDSDVSVWPGSPQLRFARRSQALDSCFRFAAWQHPPWEPAGRAHSPGLRRDIVPLVEKDGIRVVFVGHLHAYARSRPRHGVVYVAVGTGGATLDNDAGKLTIPLARIVQGRFGAPSVDVALREARFSYETVDGRVRDHFRVTCSTATLPRPRSTP